MKRVLYILVFFISFSKLIIKANEPLNSKITIGWKDDEDEGTRRGRKTAEYVRKFNEKKNVQT